MTATIDRRALVAGLAGAAIAGPAVASAAEPDPIFAVIEEHREAYRLNMEAQEHWMDLEDEIDPEKRKTPDNVYFNEGSIVQSDDPRWIAACRRTHATILRAHRAEWSLVDTSPTTHAGLLAWLAYLGEHQALALRDFDSGSVWPDRRIGESADQDQDRDAWAESLIRSLARAASTVSA